jgi:predicted nuclease of predicted toxin-antitoxin system
MLNDGPPPKVVWLRVGNMRRQKLQDFFNTCWPSIFAALRDYDLIEVFPQKIEALSFAREEK